MEESTVLVGLAPSKLQNMIAEQVMSCLRAFYGTDRGKDATKRELGGLDLAVEVTRLQPRTIYKKCHFKTIPHSKKGGRLYFRRSELEQWIADGRQKTVDEEAADVMRRNNNAR